MVEFSIRVFLCPQFREKITFALLKEVPHVQNCWGTYCEKNSSDESRMFETNPTWASFIDVVREQYYLMGNYDYLYTNKFHTLHTKLSIKYSERHLILKYRSGLHRYIRTKMDFLDISSLGVAYRYAAKIEEKF